MKSVLALGLLAVLVLLGWAWLRPGPGPAGAPSAPAARSPAAPAEGPGRPAPGPVAIAAPDVEASRQEPDPRAALGLAAFGTVTAADTGAPVVGARVRVALMQAGGYELLAEGQVAADGSYRLDLEALDGVPETARAGADLLVGASAEGYGLAAQRVPLRELLGAPAAIDLRLAPELAAFGRVTDASSDEPVAGADVRVFLRRGDANEPLARSQTAADGSYRFDLEELGGVPELARTDADLLLQAHAAGYVPAGQSVPLGVFLSAPRGIDLRLAPGASLRGRVLAPSGQPAVGASVSFERVQEREGLRPMVYMTSARTDGRGEFALAADHADPAKVTATQEGFVPVVRSLIGWDLEARPDIGDLVLGRGAAISGRVLCADGTPVPGVEVKTLLDPAGPSSEGVTTRQASTGRTDAFGVFELRGLVGEQFELELDRRETFGPFPSGAAGVELTLSSRILVVTVRDEAGHPLAGREVDVVLGSLDGERVRAERWSSTEARGPGARAVFLAGDATAATLRTEGPDGHPFERLIELPLGPCFTEAELVVPSELPLGWVAVELDGAEQLDGRLLLESPIDGEELYDCSYRVREVPLEVVAGRYRAVVTVGDTWTDGYLPLIDFIEVRPGETTRIERPVEVGGRLSLELVSSVAGDRRVGHVFLKGGDELERLSFYDGHASRGISGPRPGSPYLAQRAFPPGLATLEVQLADHRTVTETVRIVSGEIAEVRVVLLPEDG